MNTKLALSAALALASIGATCLAQNSNLSAPSTTGLTTAESRAPDRIIYLGKLPTPAELAGDAAARNVSVVRMEQTDKSIVVFYQTSGGAVTSDAYELMASAGIPNAPAVPTAPTVPSAPVLSAPTAPAVYQAPPVAPTTVVVPTTPAPPVVYYDYSPAAYYYPYPVDYPFYYRYPGWEWYAPVGINLNFGWRGGVWHGSGIRNGLRGGYHFHR